jgi:hypothetical protein
MTPARWSALAAMLTVKRRTRSPTVSFNSIVPLAHPHSRRVI